MYVIPKEITNITQLDLEFLISNAENERKNIEYKQTLPEGKDRDKKEFLADVSSFANASGGDLIYGIKAVDGFPTEILGLPDINIDQEKLRLENLIQSGLRPRINGISLREIETEHGFCIIVRIPKSWNSPHRVILGNHAQFYSRNSGGKYQLDVDDLRIAFALGESQAEKIRAFRAERLATLIANEGPVELDNDTKLVIHLVPVDAFLPGSQYDVNLYPRKDISLQPLFSFSGWGHLINFDGFLSYTTDKRGTPSYSYTQFFRNGIIEAATSSFPVLQNKRKSIFGLREEGEVLDRTWEYLKLQDKLGVTSPKLIMISFLSVRGCVIEPPNIISFDSSGYHPIERDNLILPDIMFDDLQLDLQEILKPNFNAIWNSVGIAQSPEHKWGKR